MRLANGIVIDKEATFGNLKFSALRREVHLQNEDATVSDEIKERTYDLKSRGQERMIQVSIPSNLPLKEFDYNADDFVLRNVKQSSISYHSTVWEQPNVKTIAYLINDIINRKYDIA